MAGAAVDPPQHGLPAGSQPIWTRTGAQDPWSSVSTRTRLQPLRPPAPLRPAGAESCPQACRKLTTKPSPAWRLAPSRASSHSHVFTVAPVCTQISRASVHTACTWQPMCACRQHPLHAGTQCEHLGLHTHRGYTVILTFTPIPPTLPHTIPHMQVQLGTHAHTHTHTSALAPTGPEPAGPAKHEMPQGEPQAGSPRVSPGHRQGHCQGKGKVVASWVGLDGERSQTHGPGPSTVAGAQNTHHQASESIRGVSLSPKGSLFNGSLLFSPISLASMPGFSPPPTDTT